MRIETFENLVRYIDKHFDQLSEVDYQEIIWQSLGMLILKDDTKKKTIDNLRTYYEKWGHLPISERALFPDIDFNLENEEVQTKNN
jgi:hypothetical protein